MSFWIIEVKKKIDLSQTEVIFKIKSTNILEHQISLRLIFVFLN